MEELQALNWFDGSEQEQLLRELLENDSSFFLLPEPSSTHESGKYCPSSSTGHLPSSSQSVTNRLVSNIYSGPTIEDIETALSLKNPTTIDSTNPIITSRLGVSLLEKASSKVDNKYTLKIKTCGDGLSDDGYKWRKYGQKSIKNSSNPRSYYRCTNPRCSAKKQVERSNEDPVVLIITYEGLHLHFTYSHFLPTQIQIQTQTQTQTNHHPYPSMKKLKCNSSSSNSNNNSSTSQNQEEDDKEEEPQALETLSLVEPTVTNPALVGFQEEQLFEGIGSQGLLEDMVPLMIRNPPTKNNSTIKITWSNSSSSSSYPSSPPTSSSSFSWSPNCSSFDVGVISSTTIYEGL